MKIPACESCSHNRVCDEIGNCSAINTLVEIYNDARYQQKEEIIKRLRSELDVRDYEEAHDLKELAEKVISAMPELGEIRAFNIRVAYVRSYEAKRDKGKVVYADCRKVNGTYTAYLPFDFIVTFYEPNTYILSENQKKILMLHELRHIGIGERGFRIENHDVEDFRDILYRFGIEWNGFNQDVEDILAGGGDGQKQGHKQEQKRSKKR